MNNDFEISVIFQIFRSLNFIESNYEELHSKIASKIDFEVHTTTISFFYFIK